MSYSYLLLCDETLRRETFDNSLLEKMSQFHNGNKDLAFFLCQFLLSFDITPLLAVYI